MRFGLIEYGPVDFSTARTKEIRLGLVGSAQTVGKLGEWLRRCEHGIPAKNSRQPNLFPAFPGSTISGPFRCSFEIDAHHVRTLSPALISRITTEKSDETAIATAVEAFTNEVKDLAERDQPHPPLRGTAMRLDDERSILYTRGSVDFFRTYPGLYVPNPLMLHAQRRDTPDWILLLKETLALTKMNWNGTQFDGALPITLKAARQVGDILKYVPDGTTPDPRYRFYM